jgi:orotate phosphoribosyltransferase
VEFFEDPKSALVDHLMQHAVRTDGPFVLRSGETSEWYVDARQTTYSGAGALLVGRAVLDHVPDDVVAVGGMTMGADPIAVATAMVAAIEGRSLSSFSIRKEAKDHGVGGRLVGPVTAGDRVIAIEDTTTTGTALADAIAALRADDVTVAGAIALVDRSNGAAAARMASIGVPYIPLIVPADLGVGV